MLVGVGALVVGDPAHSSRVGEFSWSPLDHVSQLANRGIDCTDICRQMQEPGDGGKVQLISFQISPCLLLLMMFQIDYVNSQV